MTELRLQVVSSRVKLAPWVNGPVGSALSSCVSKDRHVGRAPAARKLAGSQHREVWRGRWWPDPHVLKMRRCCHPPEIGQTNTEGCATNSLVCSMFNLSAEPFRWSDERVLASTRGRNSDCDESLQHPGRDMDDLRVVVIRRTSTGRGNNSRFAARGAPDRRKFVRRNVWFRCALQCQQITLGGSETKRQHFRTSTHCKRE